MKLWIKIKSLCLTAAIVGSGLSLTSVVTAQLSPPNIDVYFITGQSNATNLGESSGANGISGDEEVPGTGLAFTNVGFNLNVARIGDRGSRDPDVTTLFGDQAGDSIFGNSNVQPNFSSSNLNTGTAITSLASNLHQTNDLGIYTFARGGRPLANENNANDAGESWYPGSSDISIAANQYDDELYGAFKLWGQNRLDTLTIAGFNPIVKGIFWFQGEQDSNIGVSATSAYEENFTNLIARFREDFGANVPVVAAEIRVTGTGTSALNDRQNEVNAALAAVAMADPLVGLIGINDLIPTSNNSNDVHLDKGRGAFPNQYVIVADRWASEMNAINSVPEPSSLLLIGFSTVVVMTRRRRIATAR